MWFRIDDGFYRHRKVRRLGSDKVLAVGVWTLAGAHSAEELSDGFVPHEVIRQWDRDGAMTARLVEVGLWELAHVDGEDGVQFHDWLDYNPSRAFVLAERAYNARKAALHRDKPLLLAVRTRDENRCRYCGTLANWKDRRSGAGATYDHVDPSGPNSLDNLVVACRSCNSEKLGRTPDEAGMPLLPPGSMGLAVADGSGSVLDTEQIGSRSVQVPGPTRPDPGPPPTSGDPGEGGEQPAAAAPSVPAAHVPTSSPEARAEALRVVAARSSGRRRSKRVSGARPLVASVRDVVASGASGGSARPAPGSTARPDPRAEQDRLAELDAVQAADPAPAERVPPSSDLSGPPADLQEQETA